MGVPVSSRGMLVCGLLFWGCEPRAQGAVFWLSIPLVPRAWACVGCSRLNDFV